MSIDLAFERAVELVMERDMEIAKLHVLLRQARGDSRYWEAQGREANRRKRVSQQRSNERLTELRNQVSELAAQLNPTQPT